MLGFGRIFLMRRLSFNPLPKKKELYIPKKKSQRGHDAFDDPCLFGRMEIENDKPLSL